VRAVNGQGMKGAPVASGPILVDLTAPPTPSAAMVIVALKPRINITTPNDPESGIARVEMTVGTASGGTDILGWTRVTGATTGSYQAALPALPLKAGTKYWLSFRSVNGVGAESKVFKLSWVAP